MSETDNNQGITTSFIFKLQQWKTKREAQDLSPFAYFPVPQVQFSPHRQGSQEQFDLSLLICIVVFINFVFMLLINLCHKAMTT
jgi:hypothetical protein